MNITFVTYAAQPEPSSNDALVADWLTKQGHHVKGVPWTEELDRFMDADLVVVRSTWDYPQNVQRFRAWLDETRDRLPIANPIDLMKWNMNKRYLLDLQRQGFRIPRSAVLDDPKDIHRILEDWSAQSAVIKPLIGASGVGVERVQPGFDVSGLEPSQYLMQEFVPEISQGELSLAFFGGEFSHAVIKKPAAGEFRINSAHGGEISAIEPSPDVVGHAARVANSLAFTPLYARVDGVMVDGEFVVFELELIEPSFFFTAVPAAAQRFGRAILRRALQSK